MTQVFFEARDSGITIYRDGDPAIIAVKFADYVRLAKESLDGLLMVPDPQGGDVFEWVDHPALLRLSAAASAAAACCYT